MKILIVSNEPELYRASFFDVLNRAVYVTDEAAKALAIVHTQPIDKVFVTFAQMDNKWNDRNWSGQTFVRDLCSQTPFKAEHCYYLATDLSDTNKAWIDSQQKVGGVLGKSPLDISAAAFGLDFKDASKQLFGQINHAFMRVAGPMGNIVISSVLPRVGGTARSPSVSSYIDLLAQNIVLDVQRQTFLAAVRQIMRTQR